MQPGVGAFRPEAPHGGPPRGGAPGGGDAAAVTAAMMQQQQQQQQQRQMAMRMVAMQRQQQQAAMVQQQRMRMAQAQAAHAAAAAGGGPPVGVPPVGAAQGPTQPVPSMYPPAAGAPPTASGGTRPLPPSIAMPAAVGAAASGAPATGGPPTSGAPAGAGATADATFMSDATLAADGGGGKDATATGTRKLGPPVTPYRQWFCIRKAQGGDSSRLIRIVSMNCSTEIRAKRQYNTFMSLIEDPKAAGMSYYHSKWTHRFPLLQRELLEQSPDIICLQEVDKFEEYSEVLAARGYQGVYERRPFVEGKPYFVNGVATFWNTEKFRLIGRGVYMLGGKPRFDDTDNVALCTRLEKIDAKLSSAAAAAKKATETVKTEDGEEAAAKTGEEVKATPTDAVPPKTAGATVVEMDSTTIDVWNAQLFDGRFETVRLAQAQSLLGIIGTASNQELELKSALTMDDTKGLDGADETGGESKEDLRAKFTAIYSRAVESVKVDSDVTEDEKESAVAVKSADADEKKSEEDEAVAALQKEIDSFELRKTDLETRAKGGDVPARKAAAELAALLSEDRSDLQRRMVTAQAAVRRASKAQSKSPEPPVTAVTETSTEETTEATKATEEITVVTTTEEESAKGKKPEVEKKKKREAVADSGPSTKAVDSGKAYYSGRHEPVDLKRPVILAIDTGGDCIPYRSGVHSAIDIRSYMYLTHRSRTTKELPFTFSRPDQALLPRTEQTIHENWHAYFLQSAYALGFGREPDFTHYVRTRSKKEPLCMTRNFIMFTPQNFRVLNLLDIFNREWIEQQETHGLPCFNYPSDHVLVGVDLEVATFKGVKSVEKREHPALSTSHPTYTAQEASAGAPATHGPVPGGPMPGGPPHGGYPGQRVSPAPMRPGFGGPPPRDDPRAHGHPPYGRHPGMHPGVGGRGGGMPMPGHPHFYGGPPPEAFQHYGGGPMPRGPPPQMPFGAGGMVPRPGMPPMRAVGDRMQPMYGGMGMRMPPTAAPPMGGMHPAMMDPRAMAAAGGRQPMFGGPMPGGMPRMG